MPGQGYHFGFGRLVADQAGKKFSKEMRVGDLVQDALNAAAGTRRNSHFTGGAGCVLPQFNELRQSSKIQGWDSGFKKSYLVDPRIDMRLMEAASIHIPEGDYKDGIRLHLLADRAYDQLVQTKIFDVSRQKDGIIVVRATGEELDGANFRTELYASYPLLDQYVMRKAGITAEDVAEVKELLKATMTDAHAEFIGKYLNFNPDFEWRDTKFFTREMVDNLLDEAVADAIRYLKW